MNWIWAGLIIISIVFAIINGRVQEVVDALFNGAELAVQTAIYLIGIMAFWLGIMKIAEKSGFSELISKLVKPVMKVLFKDIAHDDEAVSAITLNISANALGVSNAATPIGIKAMEKMQEHNIDKKSASNSMCTFLAMNTAGFQLIPATVIAILAANHASNPTKIIIPTLIVTTLTFIFAICVVKILERFWVKQENTGGKQDDYFC